MSDIPKFETRPYFSHKFRDTLLGVTSFPPIHKRNEHNCEPLQKKILSWL